MGSDEILTINDELESKIWSEKSIDDKVKEKLLMVAEDFFEKLELESGELEDVTFTGSLANYNYTKFSDIDLHLIVDFTKIDENRDLVRDFFSAKTANWNNKHNITIFGYEIEIYIQDTSEDHHSTGVFSLKNNEWVAEPIKIDLNVDTDMVKRKALSFVDMIERAEDLFDDKKFEKSHSFASNLISKIKKFREAGLEDKGEYSNENLAFKYLRNNKYIDELHKIRNDSYDRMMSLGGKYHRKFKIFIDQGPENEKTGFQRLDELGKFQKRVKKHHKRRKRRLIGLGKQKTGKSYPKKPNYRRSKSAPVGYGGS